MDMVSFEKKVLENLGDRIVEAYRLGKSGVFLGVLTFNDYKDLKLSLRILKENGIIDQYSIHKTREIIEEEIAYICGRFRKPFNLLEVSEIKNHGYGKLFVIRHYDMNGRNHEIVSDVFARKTIYLRPDKIEVFDGVYQYYWYYFDIPHEWLERRFKNKLKHLFQNLACKEAFFEPMNKLCLYKLYAYFPDDQQITANLWVQTGVDDKELDQYYMGESIEQEN